MARPMKAGLDYFPLDVHPDEKIELIEAKYGLEGFAIAIKLFQQIYSGSYFWDVNEAKLLLFKKKINADINLVIDIINDCLCWQLFDKELYDRYQILTSRGIQKRYMEAIRRRNGIVIINDYWLLSEEETNHPNVDYVDLNPVDADINLRNADINTQRKEKKNKENYSKENKRIHRADTQERDIEKKLYGKHILLSGAEYRQLVEMHPKEAVSKCIATLNNQYDQVGGEVFDGLWPGDNHFEKLNGILMKWEETG